MVFFDQYDRQVPTNQLELAVSLDANIFDMPESVLDEDGLITCPLIPLRGMVLYPRMVTPIFVGRPRSVKAIDAAAASNRSVLVVAQRDGEVYDPQPGDLYDVGTEVVIGRALRMPEDTMSVLAQGRHRVEIVEIVQWEPYIKARARLLPDIPIEPESATVQMRAALSLFERVVELNPNVPEDMYVVAMNIEEPGWLADLISSAVRLELSERQNLLETLDPMIRLERLNTFLAKELDLLELEESIRSQVQEQVDRSQRELFLREQMRAIQSELGEGDIFAEELQEVRERAEKKELPEHVRTRVEREIARLAAMPPMMPEVGVIRNYLDWLLDLPWSETTEDNLDLPAVEAALDADHYGLKKAKERVLEFLAVKRMAPDKMRSPILCFVGPPGTGKTSLGSSIAHALGREFVRVSLGGVRDEAEIRGHRRTYIGALPGRIIQTMRRAGTVNPLFMLDEIDKLGADFRGDPAAALLEVLDPEQNNAFSDHYLDLDYDLSKVMFITTANYLGPIPPALEDRLEIIEFGGYTEEEKLSIARRFLIPKQLEANGVTEAGIHFSESALQTLVRDYTYEAGVRNLDREIANVCRKIARKVAQGTHYPRRLNDQHVQKLLGPPDYIASKPMDEDEVGVATGVAWTPGGGDLMAIEVGLMEQGKGNITLTGQLGEVMQESAQTAFSFLRSHARQLGLNPKLFDQLDVHIHAPEGAVPKDGPSAGVTLLVALASAYSGRPVDHTVAMTGEITLRGRVLPVGGVKEKLLAVRRGGLKTFVMPRKNEKDLIEIPKRLLKDIDLVLTDRVQDVLAAALLPDVWQAPVLEEEEE